MAWKEVAQSTEPVERGLGDLSENKVSRTVIGGLGKGIADLGAALSAPQHLKAKALEFVAHPIDIGIEKLTGTNPQTAKLFGGLSEVTKPVQMPEKYNPQGALESIAQTGLTAVPGAILGGGAQGIARQVGTRLIGSAVQQGLKAVEAPELLQTIAPFATELTLGQFNLNKDPNSSNLVVGPLDRAKSNYYNQFKQWGKNAYANGRNIVNNINIEREGLKNETNKDIVKRVGEALGTVDMHLAGNEGVANMSDMFEMRKSIGRQISDLPNTPNGQAERHYLGRIVSNVINPFLKYTTPENAEQLGNLEAADAIHKWQNWSNGARKMVTSFFDVFPRAIRGKAELATRFIDTFSKTNDIVKRAGMKGINLLKNKPTQDLILDPILKGYQEIIADNPAKFSNYASEVIDNSDKYFKYIERKYPSIAKQERSKGKQVGTSRWREVG